MIEKPPDYKSLFRDNLEPFLSMLENLQPRRSPQEWKAMVSRIRSGISRDPQQYLGSDLPPRPEVIKIVDAIFEDFFNTQAR